MKKLDLDLDLLLESFTLDKEGICEEFLDTITGEIVNIPAEVAMVVKSGGNTDNLQEWQKLLLEDAEAVYSDEEERYKIIPTIKSKYIYKIMMDFASEKINDVKAKEQLDKALRKMQPMASFKTEIYNFPDLIDQWHKYEEKKIKDYIINWLSENQITLV